MKADCLHFRAFFVIKKQLTTLFYYYFFIFLHTSPFCSQIMALDTLTGGQVSKTPKASNSVKNQVTILQWISGCTGRI